MLVSLVTLPLALSPFDITLAFTSLAIACSVLPLSLSPFPISVAIVSFAIAVASRLAFAL